uniref:Uncharacterized protein n=1 Tax=Anguilla anguilla TaxID=7936 RepID=A0A0E9X845_ANGAN
MTEWKTNTWQCTVSASPLSAKHIFKSNCHLERGENKRQLTIVVFLAKR